jgi:hypothetical protein
MPNAALHQLVSRNYQPGNSRRRFGCLLALVFVFLTSQFSQANSGTNSEPANIFTAGYVGRLRIDIPEEGVSSLRRSPRRYVTATVKEGALTYTNVAVHLKGRAGSFRPIDQNPALTLNFGKFAEGQTFHGFKKIHLNNSVQDPTYLHEKVSRDMFLAAGVPVPRAAHAVVQLNGSRTRLCVLVEGANKQFLKRHFQSAKGNLYDGGFCHDITSRLRLNSGDSPINQSDLRALARAAAEPDLDKRGVALERVLDVNRFLSFLAMEIMISHWDGYALNVNNYRIYHDPGSDKMVFLPHGTDQVFQNTSMIARPRMKGIVAQAVMELPELNARYLDRMRYLLTNVFIAARLTNEVAQTAARIRPFIRDGNSEGGMGYEQLVSGFCRQIARRRQFLERELMTRPVPIAFDPRGNAPLPEWKPVIHIGSPQLQKNQGDHLLCMVVEANSVGSWRTQILLKPGRYRFSGRVKASNLDLPTDDPKAGISLRISRQNPERRIKTGTDWTNLTCDFEVQDNSSVELICEFRGLKGDICFDQESLQVTRR